jgi:hypothetical protein
MGSGTINGGKDAIALERASFPDIILGQKFSFQLVTAETSGKMLDDSRQVA